jgi:cobalt-zinc-cadmium efflux system outer membrane protein
VIEYRPELKMAEREIERSEASRSLARLVNFPDFTARVEARQFNGENEIREYDAFLGVTLPIWFWKNRAVVKEASKSLAAAEAGYVSMKNMVLFEAQDALVRVQSKEKQLRRYQEEILPQAEQAFEEARKGYESNQTGFLDLLDAQRMLNMFEMDHYRTLADLEIARADLERAVGVPLDEQTVLTEELPHAKKK